VQSSQTACQTLNHLIMTTANELMLKVRLKEDGLGIGTGSKGAFLEYCCFSFFFFVIISCSDFFLCV